VDLLRSVPRVMATDGTVMPCPSAVAVGPTAGGTGSCAPPRPRSGAVRRSIRTRCAQGECVYALLYGRVIDVAPPLTPRFILLAAPPRGRPPAVRHGSVQGPASSSRQLLQNARSRSAPATPNAAPCLGRFR